MKRPHGFLAVVLMFLSVSGCTEDGASTIYETTAKIPGGGRRIPGTVTAILAVDAPGLGKRLTTLESDLEALKHRVAALGTEQEQLRTELKAEVDKIGQAIRDLITVVRERGEGLHSAAPSVANGNSTSEMAPGAVGPPSLGSDEGSVASIGSNLLISICRARSMESGRRLKLDLRAFAGIRQTNSRPFRQLRQLTHSTTTPRLKPYCDCGWALTP